MKTKCTIYKITNQINGKLYIGQTWSGDLKRYFATSHAVSRGRPKLFNAIRKYGKDNFVIDAICLVDNQQMANEQEDYYIKYYDSIKNGYNLREGGSAGKHNKETKRLISEANARRKISSKTRAKMSRSHQGKKLSDVTRQKMSRKKVGKHTSPSTEFKPGHTFNRMFSPDVEQLIIQKYTELRSSYKVAEIFGCNSSTVLNVIRRHKSTENNNLPSNKIESSTESDNN